MEAWRQLVGLDVDPIELGPPWDKRRAGVEAAVLVDLATRLIVEEQLRRAILPAAPLAEPTWELLLYLFIAQEIGTQVRVSDIATLLNVVASDVPGLLDRLVAARLVSIATVDGLGAQVMLCGEAVGTLRGYFIKLHNEQPA